VGCGVRVEKKITGKFGEEIKIPTVTDWAVFVNTMN
jgi:hypothetical protein